MIHSHSPFGLNKFTRSKTLLLLREAFTALLPIVLVMSVLVLFSGLTSLLEGWGITGASSLNGNEVNRLYYFLIPLFLNIALSTILAKEKELDQIGTILISMVCFFRVSGFLAVDASSQLTSYHGSILTSIPATWVAVYLVNYFSKVPRFQLIKQYSDLSPRIQKTLNLLIPGLLTVLCFEFVGKGLQLIWATGIIALLIQSLPRFSQLGEIQELILFKVISQITWFLGIHGEHSADGFFRILNSIPTGEPSSIRLKTFYDVFMNIGGSGSTFIIPFLLLFSQKTTQFRTIAQLSLPFAFFNVNEILLFGLPIILNPIFLIPFVLAPFVNMIIALIAMQNGAFIISPEPQHWMTPPFYSAYIATQGSGLGVLTQVLCLVVDSFIYYPFLVIAGHQFKTPQYLLKLFGEDAYSLVHEEINHQEERLFFSQQRVRLDSITSAQQVLRQLRGGKFILYYQPKIDIASEKLVGLEALLRFQDVMDNILSPDFLPVLYQQGLSKVLDRKVVNLVFEQVKEWRSSQMIVPPISLNFDKDFLLDPQLVQDFMDQAKVHQIQFCLEITEHTYTTKLEALASTIRHLRAAGHTISIDDFGAGYSSLTSLLNLEADEIKLDRKLLDIPRKDRERGQILLESSVQLCHKLGFSVVAEGVEDLSHLRLAKRCGVDIVQGYYIGKPMPPQQVRHLFSQMSDPETIQPLATMQESHEG